MAGSHPCRGRQQQPIGIFTRYEGEAIMSTEPTKRDMTAVPDMKLELVPVPVSDVDRAKAFYVEKVGFNLDHDVQPSDTMRVVQLTPLGSACSIVIGTGMGEISEWARLFKGLHLVAADAARAISRAGR
jgi:hypothetical protein